MPDLSVLVVIVGLLSGIVGLASGIFAGVRWCRRTYRKAHPLWVTWADDEGKHAKRIRLNQGKVLYETRLVLNTHVRRWAGTYKLEFVQRDYHSLALAWKPYVGTLSFVKPSHQTEGFGFVEYSDQIGPDLTIGGVNGVSCDAGKVAMIEFTLSTNSKPWKGGIRITAWHTSQARKSVVIPVSIV